MNRFSLMTYGVLAFLLIGVVVTVNLWVGAQIDEPIPTTPVAANIKPPVRKEYSQNPPLDPRTDPLTPVIQVPAKPAPEDPQNPPKRYYEPSLTSGDVLAM